MPTLGRGLLAAALLAGLPGCNNVVSMEPWFTSVDAGGVPDFRDGLWLSVFDVDCRVDVDKPAERWPDCAQASFRRGNESWAMTWHDPDSDDSRQRTFAGWRSDPSLLVGGDPLILQVEWSSLSADDNTIETADTAIEPAEPEEPDWRYFYAAVRPIRFDEEGRVIAVENWTVKCGPIAGPLQRKKSRRRRDQPEEDAPNVTDQPFPGLTIVGNNCTAESAGAVRRAAALSEPLEAHGTSRWVREGWR